MKYAFLCLVLALVACENSAPAPVDATLDQPEVLPASDAGDDSVVDASDSGLDR